MLKKTISILITALFALTGSSAFASDQQQDDVKKWQPQTPRVKKEVRQEQHLKQQQLKEENRNMNAAQPPDQMQQPTPKSRNLNMPLDRQMEKRIGPSGGTP